MRTTHWAVRNLLQPRTDTQRPQLPCPSSPAAVVVVKAPGHNCVIAIGGSRVVLAHAGAGPSQPATNHRAQDGRARVVGGQAQCAIDKACGSRSRAGSACVRGSRCCSHSQLAFSSGQTAAAPLTESLSTQPRTVSPPLGLLAAQLAYTLALRTVTLDQGGSQPGRAAGAGRMCWEFGREL